MANYTENTFDRVNKKFDEYIAQGGVLNNKIIRSKEFKDFIGCRNHEVLGRVFKNKIKTDNNNETVSRRLKEYIRNNPGCRLSTNNTRRSSNTYNMEYNKLISFMGFSGNFINKCIKKLFRNGEILRKKQTISGHTGWHYIYFLPENYKERTDNMSDNGGNGKPQTSAVAIIEELKSEPGQEKVFKPSDLILKNINDTVYQIIEQITLKKNLEIEELKKKTIELNELSVFLEEELKQSEEKMEQIKKQKDEIKTKLEEKIEKEKDDKIYKDRDELLQQNTEYFQKLQKANLEIQKQKEYLSTFEQKKTEELNKKEFFFQNLLNKKEELIKNFEKEAYELRKKISSHHGLVGEIKKECGEEVSKLKTLIEEYRQKLILKDEQIKVILEDNKLLAKLVGEKYGQNSGS